MRNLLFILALSFALAACQRSAPYEKGCAFDQYKVTCPSNYGSGIGG